MSKDVKVAVVVGNPKPQSRTLECAVAIAKSLTNAEPGLVIDLANVGPDLLDWTSPQIADHVAAVSACEVAIFASPTYKGTYTGLLKLFIDRFAADALSAVLGVPLMLGAAPVHALAPELFLKTALVEIGASCPTAGIFVIDKYYDDLEQISPVLDRARRELARALPRVERSELNLIHESGASYE